MSGDGGGAFNVNSAHPFENPTPLTNAVEIVAMLLIPVAFLRHLRCDGRRQEAGLGAIHRGSSPIRHRHGGDRRGDLGDARHGRSRRRRAASKVPKLGSGCPAAHCSVRPRPPVPTVRRTRHTTASPALGGAVLMLNMMLGEVAPGGAGSGLYGLVMMALLAVFLGGLMVGRTPEYLKQRLRCPAHEAGQPLHPGAAGRSPGRDGGGDGAAGRDERRCSTPGRTGFPRCCMRSPSSAANNGSAFAGFSGNTTWYNTALALAMVIGRFLPIIAVLGDRGHLRRPASRGHHRRHACVPTRPTFVVR